MVIKVKVSDVAKDFGKTNKEIIEILGKYCDGAAKKAGTVLEENELNRSEERRVGKECT